jgi:hypothetical protein
MRKILFLALLSASINLWAHHPIHLSIVNMELDKSKETLNYSVRLFQEDLLQLLGMLIHEELHKGRTEQEAYADTTLISKYFQENLKVFANDKELESLLLKQISEESEAWLYFSSPLPEIPDKLEIENKIYIEIFSDQINMLIFAFGSKEKAFTFNSSLTRQLIALNDI